MTATVTAAFVHHAAAFLLVAALMVELVVLRSELTLTSARSVLRMGAVYGIAATVLLIVDFVRVFYTEKGAAYYFESGSFLLKLTLFIRYKKPIEWLSGSQAVTGRCPFSSTVKCLYG